MNIGFYHDSAGTRHAGGIAIYIQYMAAKIAQDHDVFLYTQRGEIVDLLAESPVKIIETPSFEQYLPNALTHISPLTSQDHEKIAMTCWGLWNSVCEHIENTIDVLITCQWVDDLLLSNIIDTETVFICHSSDSIGLGATVRETFSQTETVLANSHRTAEQLTEQFGATVERVIYPGVDTDKFHPGVSPAFSSDVPVILFVGRVVESKGVFDLLDAFSTIEIPSKLYFIGRGNIDEGISQCRELGIRDSVVFKGEIPHEQLPRYYAAADVFCLPSHGESFGLVNLEAMATGLPVVTSDLRSIRRYITDGRNGLLTRVGDTDDVAEKIELCLSSPAMRTELGDNGWKTALEFSWKKQALQLSNLCESVQSGS